MTNFQLSISNYFSVWWEVMARPIYFFTRLKEEDWQGKSLTFFLVSSWIFSFFLTLTIFIVQYVPVGSTLVVGITGFKFIIILPVLLALALTFFTITLLIVGGLMVIGLGGGFWAISGLLHFTYIILGGKGKFNQLLQQVLYSSAVVAAFIFPLVLAVLTKHGWLSFSLFKVGFNLTYVLTVIFTYGLWAVSGRKVYGVPKWKAFVGTLVPVFALLIFLLAFDKIGIAKIEPWIKPL